jgi:hypothetical protein
MTAATILRVDFREIVDFRIQCANCAAEITIPIERDLPRFLECPGCNKHLWGNGHEAKAAQITGGIKSYLKSWRELEHQAFSIGFSLPQIDSQKTTQ